MGTFTDWADLVHGPTSEWGNLTCGCHPNCGIGMAVMIDKETKEAVPVTAFLHADQLAKDLQRVNDAARGRRLSVLGMALALMKNYDPFKSPTHFKLTDLMKKFDKTFGATKKAETGGYGRVDGDAHGRRPAAAPRRSLELPVHRGHVVPGSLQLRLPPHRALHHSVCDAGRGDLLLRLQHRHRLAEHHREDAHDGDAHQVVRRARPSRDLRRRQERRSLETTHNLVLDADAVAKGKQKDLDDLGIAKNAREEKLRARKIEVNANEKSAEDERMAALYRQHVLKEQAPEPVIKIAGLGGKKKPRPGRRAQQTGVTTPVASAFRRNTQGRVE